MERASRVLGKLRFPHDSVSPEELARSVWPVAVGKTVAAHARSTGMVGDRLVVEVDDAVWQRQLYALRGQIRAKINAMLGGEVIGDIEYRISPPRRQMARATTGSPASSGDEAELIPDPLMREIYRAARRKASA